MDAHRLSTPPRTGLAVLIFALCMLSSATVWAQSPNDVVQERTGAVAEVLAEPESPERTRQLAEIIDESLDFEYLAGLALGDHWEERTEEERREFMTLLRQLLQHNYQDRLAGEELDEDYTIDYGEARTRDDRAFVEAEVTYDDREESVVYRLYRDEQEGWTIYDLVIDDISLEETYREGYVPIIEEEGWDALIERMEKRLEELRAESDE